MLPLVHIESHFLPVLIRKLLVNLNGLMRIISLSNSHFSSTVVYMGNEVVDDSTRILNSHIIGVDEVERSFVLALVDFLECDAGFIIEPLYVCGESAEAHCGPNRLSSSFSTDFEG